MLIRPMSNGLKWGYVIRQLRAYMKKHNKPVCLYWDWIQNGPRPRVRLNKAWTIEATLIGTYTQQVTDEQIVEDVEAAKEMLGLKSRPPRTWHTRNGNGERAA